MTDTLDTNYLLERSFAGVQRNMGYLERFLHPAIIENFMGYVQNFCNESALMGKSNPLYYSLGSARMKKVSEQLSELGLKRESRKVMKLSETLENMSGPYRSRTCPSSV